MSVVEESRTIMVIHLFYPIRAGSPHTELPSPTHAAIVEQGLSIDETCWQAMAEREIHFDGRRYFFFAMVPKANVFSKNIEFPHVSDALASSATPRTLAAKISLGCASPNFLAETFRNSMFLL